MPEDDVSVHELRSHAGARRTDPRRATPRSIRRTRTSRAAPASRPSAC